MKNKQKLVIFMVYGFLCIGCASKSNISNEIVTQNTDNHVSSFNLNKLKDAKELYFIYHRDKNGLPSTIFGTTEQQEVALKSFEKDASINNYDCIRITLTNEATVCNESMWFEYGKADKTRLATTKAKGTATSVANGVFITALSPLSVAIDVLNFDPKLSHTRKAFGNALTEPVQDQEELSKAKNRILQLVEQQYQGQKQQAMHDIEAALKFIKAYPKDNFADISDAFISSSVQSNQPQNIAKLLNAIAATPAQKQQGISALRTMNTFNAYATAFDLSNDVQDAKKAQEFASSANDKRKTEYMAFKLLKSKKGSINDAFQIAITDKLDAGAVSTNGAGFGWTFSESLFKNNIDRGLTDFAFRLRLQPEKQFTLFQYGDYAVVVKSILKIPKHRMMRSQWLGNVDEDYTAEIVSQETVRLSAPDYSADIPVVFKNVTATYKDRGIMGGTTEITMNGKPTVSVEVADVTLVE